MKFPKKMRPAKTILSLLYPQKSKRNEKLPILSISIPEMMGKIMLGKE
jgi:hypothetical protein